MVAVFSSCTSGERTKEVVYLEPSAPDQVTDPTEWDRFDKICEAQALGGGARHIAEMDNYPKPGCRSWWLTRKDASISFDVGVCPTREAAEASISPEPGLSEVPASAPNAIVGTWPQWWNPFSAGEAAARRAAVYDALRLEFGDRIKVVRL